MTRGWIIVVSPTSVPPDRTACPENRDNGSATHQRRASGTIRKKKNTASWGAFAGGGGILRQARPDSRREILLVAAFYGRARKATAQFYPAMATHFDGVWPNAPILNEAERTPKSLCRFIRFQPGQPNHCGTRSNKRR